MTDLEQKQATTLGKICAKLSLLGTPVTPCPDISVGPIVTVYRAKPMGSTKFSQIEGMARDIAIALGAEDVVIKRLPGETNVAVFVPNETRSMIDFKETITNVWKATDKAIPLNFGVDYLGKPFVEDLASLPHLLVAGSTNSGKSTLVSSILASIVYCREPDDISLLLSDTKNVEFGRFVGAPHLTELPATTVEDSLGQIESLTTEMEQRLVKFSKHKVRNLDEYHALGHARFARKIYVIDELADLLTDETRTETNDKGNPTGPTNGTKCMKALAKLVQKARAAGIHVIACTQRPSVNIVSGTIKANFPARLSFRLPTGFDSRTVLGTEGAEHLLAKGDMLYVSPNRHDILRLHSPYAKNEDIDAAVEMAVQRHEMKGA